MRHLKTILVDTVKFTALLAGITIVVYLLLTGAAQVQSTREDGRGFYGEVSK